MEREEFKVYREEVVVKTRSGEKKFNLLPLSGRYYGKFMRVASKFMDANKEEGLSKEEQSANFLKSIDEETFTNLHLLVLETIKHSMRITNKDELEQLDLFVSQNLMSFVAPLISVNLGQEE